MGGFKVGINYQPPTVVPGGDLAKVQPAGCQTPQPSQRPGLVWITSSISCTPSVPSSTGTLERVWRRESSVRLVRILLLLRRITRKLELTPSRVKERRMRSIKQLSAKYY